MQYCSDCGSHSDTFITDYKAGDRICINCGLVQEQHILIDDNDFFNNQFIVQNDKTLTNQINTEKTVLNDFFKINKTHHLSKKEYDKQYEQLKKITQFAQILFINNLIINQSYITFLKIMMQDESKYYNKKSLDALSAGILYIHCKTNCQNIPLKVFLNPLDVNQKSLLKALDKIKTFFKQNDIVYQETVQSPLNLINYVIKGLNLSKKSDIYKKSQDINNFIESNHVKISSTDPLNVASAIVYKSISYSNDKNEIPMNFMDTLCKISGIQEKSILKIAQSIGYKE